MMTIAVTLFYIMFCFCFIFKTREFVSAGLCVEYIFDSFLRKEHSTFIMYQIKRCPLTLLVHSFLPLVYVFLLKFFGVSLETWIASSAILKSVTLILPTIAVTTLFSWQAYDWKNHPIVKNLGIFCGERSWKDVAEDINTEYRSINKVVIHTSPVVSIIGTDNWLLKVSMYNMNIAHRGIFELYSTDEHHLSRGGSEPVQYVNVRVRSPYEGFKTFEIRCTAQEFREIKDKLKWPVLVADGIKFHKTRMEHFEDVFKEIITRNPVYKIPPDQEIETCIGCTLSPSSVKIKKRCPGNCSECRCRPLWCTDCMARWFASRQDPDHPETWLSSECTCPLCRGVFCIFDVCPLECKQGDEVTNEE